MNRKLLKLFIALLLGGLFTTAGAQKTMDVSGFSRDDADMMARITKPVRDNDEGKLCALIRVESGLKDLDVRADALGIVQKEVHNGEVWLYVPYGAKSLSFSHEGYYSLLYQYEIPIEEGVVYKLRLKVYDTPPSPDNHAQTQMFILTHHPDEATVIIDDMEVPTENGVFAAMMNKGEHTYRVISSQYEDYEGEFVLGDQPVRETVKLNPLFGTFEVRTQPVDGFDVFVNGQLVGTTPYQSGRVKPGSYNILVKKNDYVDVDTLIRVREGDNLAFQLESEDWHVYNNLLGGRNLAFGVNVGYLQPFATSSSGGGFTGSPINYSLGDSRENVEYSAQSGFTVGINADYRLYKNLYLVAGINFTQVKYSNKFEQPIANAIVRTEASKVYQGALNNNYKEDYTLGWVEIPVLASYRFVLSKTGSLHLNIGPYISYGISSKMDFSGSSECTGSIYEKRGSIADLNFVLGSFTETYHKEGKFDLNSNNVSYVTTTESGMNIGSESQSKYTLDDSPYRRLNYGIKIGAVYELRGFQFGIGYSLQLSNMANNDFWESERIPVINGQVGLNNMSGYKHRINVVEIKIGYVFRY